MPNEFDSQRSNPYTGVLSVKIVLDQRETALIPAQDIVYLDFDEDIFSFCMQGQLIFYDQHGLLEYGFTGNEMISIVYGSKDIRELVFHIWRVENIIQTQNIGPTALKQIQLTFVDSAFYNMAVKKFSRSFPANTKYSDIMKHLFKNMIGWEDKDINIEPSLNKITEPWAMPYWTAGQSLNWLGNRAVGSISGKSGYLAYNNTKNTFSVNCYSLDWLLSNQNDIDKTDYIFESGEQDELNKILEWKLLGSNKSENRLRGGKYRGFKNSTKELITESYDYSKGIKNATLLGKKSLMPDISDTAAAEMCIPEKTAYNLKNVVYSDWIKRYVNQQKLVIFLLGNEKRYAGLQIQIKWPSVNKRTQIYHKTLEGKYLIQKITNIFDAGYIQKVILIKNAYQDSNSKDLLNATTKNTTGKQKGIII